MVRYLTTNFVLLLLIRRWSQPRHYILGPVSGWVGNTYLSRRRQLVRLSGWAAAGSRF